MNRLTQIIDDLGLPARISRVNGTELMLQHYRDKEHEEYDEPDDDGQPRSTSYRSDRHKTILDPDLSVVILAPSRGELGPRRLHPKQLLEAPGRTAERLATLRFERAGYLRNCGRDILGPRSRWL